MIKKKKKESNAPRRMIQEGHATKGVGEARKNEKDIKRAVI